MSSSPPKDTSLQLCRVVSEAKYNARASRYNRTKPQPWIVRKLMVGITLGIIGYAGYVYIGRFFLHGGRGGVEELERQLGGRGGRIGLLVVFCVLYTWMLWAYAMVVVTPPGFARDYIQKSASPVVPGRSVNSNNSNNPPNGISDPDSDLGHSQDLHLNPRDILGSRDDVDDDDDDDSIGGPSYEDQLPRRRANSHSRTYGRDIDIEATAGAARLRGGTDVDTQAGVLSALPVQLRPNHHQIPTNTNTNAPSNSTPNPTTNPTNLEPPSKPLSPRRQRLASLEARRLQRDLLLLSRHPRSPFSSLYSSPSLLNPAQLNPPNQPPGQSQTTTANLPLPTRTPPLTPTLLPSHRYCPTDSIIKPYRTHHCRICGTCVLKYDHHCPWIGQCVGARNHKYFINFNLATTIFTAYTFATLLPFTVHDPSPSSSTSTSTPNSPSSDSLDVNQIILLALCLLFLLFTSLLFLTHAHMLTQHQTTVEALWHRGVKEREEGVLGGVWGFACGAFGCSASDPNSEDGGGVGDKAGEGQKQQRVFEPCAPLRSKTRIKHHWDEEWGRIGKEGNLWWHGGAEGEEFRSSRYKEGDELEANANMKKKSSTRLGWEETMGSSFLGWVFPIPARWGDEWPFGVYDDFDYDGDGESRSQSQSQSQSGDGDGLAKTNGDGTRVNGKTNGDGDDGKTKTKGDKKESKSKQRRTHLGVHYLPNPRFDKEGRWRMRREWPEGLR